MERFTQRSSNGKAVCRCEVAYSLVHCPEIVGGEAIEYFAELEDKLESGQLKEIKYPCDVGDRVYIICSQTSNNKNLYIREGICDELRVTKNEAGGYWLWVAFKGGWSVFEWQFDRVFHTPEEAEARLNELKGNK